ncbi:hypothetical protein SAMN07250955_101339 [Arboricoccus pini]|uniref:Polysaccharide deacetylase n=1 Tax=Arboricoccus pini TaxID=1963835 RepID=A0A212Q175_9PROT|nr:polysaccharide deacetylase family protein [Arboricoccus pini]SNB53111.1 hypothetical protein SAMN07250955_101339 [Arboricoccus pini]
MNAGLAALRAALDAAPTPVSFWWRDDDTGADDPALDGLLGLASELELPLALAVVPAWLAAATVERISRVDDVWVLQHGWAHVDHARDGERKIELGGTIAWERLCAQLDRGRATLSEAFGPRFLPVMVPPWNRIDPCIERQLPASGYLAISATAELGRDPSRDARFHRDIHLDVMSWKPSPTMRPLEALATALARQIAARTDERHAEEPIGLMTHHQVTGPPGMAILRELLGMLRAHPRACFLDPRSLLGH